MHGPKQQELVPAASVFCVAATKLDRYSTSFEKTSIGGNAIIDRMEDRSTMFVGEGDSTRVGEVLTQ